MKKTYMTILVLLTTLVLVTAAFAKAKPKAKAKAPAPKQAAEAKETVKPGVLSYFGKVEAVDAAKKSMVVEVSVAGELTLEEKNKKSRERRDNSRGQAGDWRPAGLN
ncbi:MAG: hypothetical protein BZ151_09600 [Desulfobacca sp. 4484_104]|nr:MAG: hypothetical protein BZ151_09600 [Desulfobacca sp. 4484_104]